MKFITSMSDNVSKPVIAKDIEASDKLQSLNTVCDKMSKIDQLLTEQRSDESTSKLFDMSVSERESNDVPVCYYVKSDVLMRKWRPVPASDDWHVVNQIIVPKCYRSEIVKIAHEFPTGGHVGVKKTHNHIQQHLYWPGMGRDVSQYCKTYQIRPFLSHLYTLFLHFKSHFPRIIIDCVGQLPKTKSGNEYLLTVMCASRVGPERTVPVPHPGYHY